MFRTAFTLRPIAFLPDEDEAGVIWADGIAKEWADALGNSKQDIYTINDGQPLDAPR